MEDEAPSFRERKAQQLNAERQQADAAPTNPTEEPAPQGTPAPEVESAQDQLDDGFQAQLADEEYEDQSSGELDEDPDDGNPSQDEQEDPEDNVDWKKRFEDTQRALSEATANRTEIEREYAESVSDNLGIKFELEDNLNQIKKRHEFLVQTMSGNANQFRNINWSAVPPDKVQEVQQQAQAAFHMEQQAQQAFEQWSEEESRNRDLVRGREAQMAKARLRRTIPGWGDPEQNVYGNIGEFAVKAGMAPEVFREITDPVVIECMYAAMTVSASPQSVTKQRRRKAQSPRGKNAQRVRPRDAKGKFVQAQTEYQSNPSRENFRGMKLAQLQAERQGR